MGAVKTAANIRILFRVFELFIGLSGTWVLALFFARSLYQILSTGGVTITKQLEPTLNGQRHPGQGQACAGNKYTTALFGALHVIEYWSSFNCEPIQGFPITAFFLQALSLKIIHKFLTIVH
jgi:hypothetical protein